MYLAVLHDNDARTERHRLGLVVRDIDDRRTQAIVELGDLGAHLDAKLGVQVRERLVHEEYLWVAHDGAAHGDALTLASRERTRLSRKEQVEVKYLGRLAYLPVDLVFGSPLHLERERHVVIHAHVRVERIVLKDHRNVAILGLYVVHGRTIDPECA